MAVACILIAIAYTCYVQLAAVMQCGTSRGCQVLIFALFTLFSFLAHDTDSSGTLANREFADVFSDVWLPIEVPKVS